MQTRRFWRQTNLNLFLISTLWYTSYLTLGKSHVPSVLFNVCPPMEGLNVTVGDPPIYVNFLPALLPEGGDQFGLEKPKMIVNENL